MPKLNLTPIHEFYASRQMALVGISNVKSKFGNYIYKQFTKRGYTVYPVHTQITEYHGKQVYPSISALPEGIDSILINTKPESTRQLIEDALAKGIRKIWLQPGSNDDKTLEGLNQDGISIITGECCIMFLDKPGFPHNLHRYFHVK